MSKEEFLQKIAEMFGAEGNDARVALSVFLQKISESLELNGSVKIPDLGIFQLKRKNAQKEFAAGKEDPLFRFVNKTDNLLFNISGDAPAADNETVSENLYESPYYLIFMPLKYENKEEGKVLCFRMQNLDKQETDVNDSVFDLSVKKPLIPVSASAKKELMMKSSFLLQQKGFEEKADGILSGAVSLSNFNIKYTRINEADVVDNAGAMSEFPEVIPENEESLELEAEISSLAPEDGVSADFETDFMNPVPGETEMIQDLQNPVETKIDEPIHFDIPLEPIQEEIPDNILPETGILPETDFNIDSAFAPDLNGMMNFPDQTDASAETIGNEDLQSLNPDEMKEIEDLISMYNTNQDAAAAEPDPWQIISDDSAQGEEFHTLEVEGEPVGEESFVVDSFEEELKKQTAALDSQTPPPAEPEPDTYEPGLGHDDESLPEAAVSGEDESLRASRRISPLFLTLVIAFIAVTAGGIYYFFFSGAGNTPVTTGSKQAGKIQTQIIERQYDIPVTVVPELSNTSESTVDTANSEAQAKLSQQQPDEQQRAGVVKPNNGGNKTPAAQTPPPSAPKEQKSGVAVSPVSNAEKRVGENIFSDGSNYMLQISSWKTKGVAVKEAERLKKSGYNAFITTSGGEGKAVWYRVRIGGFKNIKDAQAAAAKVR